MRSTDAERRTEAGRVVSRRTALRVAAACAAGMLAGCRCPTEENWSPGCEFRPCAEGRGHDYCFECAEFPCQKLQDFAADGYEHHRLAVENLKRMRDVGLEAWIAEQPEVMFCPGWHF